MASTVLRFSDGDINAECPGVTMRCADRINRWHTSADFTAGPPFRSSTEVTTAVVEPVGNYSLTREGENSQSPMVGPISCQQGISEDTWPYTCLSVAATSRLAEMAVLANRYQLLVTSSRFRGWHHLRPRLCEEGHHKRQAVRMCVAAIEVIREGAGERALLYEVSQLHVNLLRALGGDSSRYSPDGVLAQHRHMNGVLTILRPTALHLRQAGFALSSGQQEERLTNEDVRGMMQDLLHEGQASRAKTCSAF